MHRRWLTRALIALAVPVLAVPALTTSATAAGKGARVPTVTSVAKIYPHLAGGTSHQSTSKVYGPGKACKSGKAIKGASARFASYSPDYSSGDPSLYAMTGARPSIYVSAVKFRNAKGAIRYLHGYAKSSKRCPGANPGGNGNGGGAGQPKCKSSMKKIRFKLGNERWGYQIRSTCKIGTRTTSSVSNTLFARKGRFIVYTGATSMDTTAPSIPKSVALTRLAVRTAR